MPTPAPACAQPTLFETVPSDGLTVDTPLGPVDLVAVARAKAGRPVTLTRAERHYLTHHRHNAPGPAGPLGLALDLTAPARKAA